MKYVAPHPKPLGGISVCLVCLGCVCDSWKKCSSRDQKMLELPLLWLVVFFFCSRASKQIKWMQFNESKPSSPKTPNPFVSANSNTIVSCPSCSFWGSEALCSLIFLYGNMLHQRKWACSAQDHTHQLNLDRNSSQTESQTQLAFSTVTSWVLERRKQDISLCFPSVLLSFLCPWKVLKYKGVSRVKATIHHKKADWFSGLNLGMVLCGVQFNLVD